MKISGRRIIFLGWAGAVIAGAATIMTNLINASYTEEYKKDPDYKKWNKLIEKAKTRDVCEGKLGGEWIGDSCAVPKEMKGKIILPSRFREESNLDDCFGKGGYQRNDKTECIDPGIIFLPAKEFNFNEDYEEMEINVNHGIFKNSERIFNLLSTGGVSEQNGNHKPTVRMKSDKKKYIVSFGEETFSAEEYRDYTFPNQIHGVAIEHLCARLDFPNIFKKKGEKGSTEPVKREKIYLYSEKSKNMWNCEAEKHVKLIEV